jgi:uncharacterized protein YfcZ (UPF0381/DUF406 family)
MNPDPENDEQAKESCETMIGDLEDVKALIDAVDYQTAVDVIGTAQDTIAKLYEYLTKKAE